MTRHWRKIIFLGLCSCVIAVPVFISLSLLFPLPPPKPYSLVVVDRNEQILQAFLSDDGMWRLKTASNEIPGKIKRILIQKEDRYFYLHPGVNPFSVVRAIVQNIRAGHRVSGASTLTMQVARMMEPKRRTYLNKLIEIFRAFQLELKYSKNEILEMYLSMVPLGGNIEGLKSASMIYFQTAPERLNLAQLFDLILIPSDPNNLRPDRHPERLFAERKRQASRWIRSGFFTKLDSCILWQSPPAVSRKTIPRFAPHYCLQIKMRYSREGRVTGEIRTSLDLRMQRNVEALLTNHLRPWRLRAVKNGAVVVIQNRTRDIVSYVGSQDFDDTLAQGQVDAAQSLRSPGSTLKPFLYALQMDRGLLTPKTRLLDTPYDAEGYLAENYDGKYSGLVYADEALRRSLNVPMIRLLRETGVPDFVSFANDVGISSLKAQRERLGLSLIVGGCGVTLVELTAAYASFPAAGFAAEPNYLRTTNAPSKQGRQVFSSSAAFMVTDILSGLDRPDLPNNFESALNLPKVAFKTGTSYGRRDAWAIGYSAEYTVGVWIGNVSHRGNPELTGGKAAAPLLIDVFNSISTSGQRSILPMPGDVQIQEVCATSGLLPTRYCGHRIDDYFSVRHTLPRFCTIDREYLVSPDNKISYCPSCVGSNNYRIRTYQDYPTELLSFWNSIGRAYTTIPVHNPLCPRLFGGVGPAIVSPSKDMTYFLLSKNQKISLQANSSVDISEHWWYLDSRFLTKDKPTAKVFIPIAEGEHTISCMDNKGRISSVRVRIKYAM